MTLQTLDTPPVRTKAAARETTKPSRVLVVDDHPLMRLGLKNVIGADPTLVVDGEAGTAAHAVEMFRAVQPDVVLMDLRLPDSRGATAVEAIRRERGDAKVIVLSSSVSEEDVYGAVAAGARAYVLKTIDAADLRAVMHSVLRGERHFAGDVAACLASRRQDSELTTRELDVLKLMVRGKRNRHIAQTLGISTSTVKTHVANILGKLKVADRTAAATAAIERGIISLSGQTSY